ncbi:GNAT family N-acetyltransferase [Microbacterium ulmi]|uniref:GNAT family N-acetyltransferase n=1 Tax=Microbacterium ulmi TaxID=179095 RepID=A0A7Y2M2M4_9MICO|nr:GNAT family N-acetyltransferase [Microbacterium ulmi]NII70072.1 RimJ/RimL family protein N-acetyltransferase [Microbacterium ulmi]NNH05182.1 GNAT family N-acetyltransferase [Microbacterium ulmi]
MTEYVVRAATLDDAAPIARVQVQAWHEAYTGRMPQSVLDGLGVQKQTRMWERVLRGEFASPGSGVWVAEQGGEVVGFASAGACLDRDALPGRIQLYAINAVAAHHGSGVGQALLDAAIGDAAASLWVLDDNPRARAFYTRNGFALDGAVQDDDTWGEPIREVRLVRSGR